MASTSGESAGRSVDIHQRLNTRSLTLELANNYYLTPRLGPRTCRDCELLLIFRLWKHQVDKLYVSSRGNESRDAPHAYTSFNDRQRHIPLYHYRMSTRRLLLND